MTQASRSRQLEDRGSVASAAPLPEALDLELTRSCRPGLAQPTGLGAQPGTATPEEVSICLCGCKTVTFSLCTGDSC